MPCSGNVLCGFAREQQSIPAHRLHAFTSAPSIQTVAFNAPGLLAVTRSTIAWSGAEENAVRSNSTSPAV